MKIGRTAVAVAGLAAAAVAAPVAAQNDTGLYVGGSYGYSVFKNSCKRAIVPCDNEDTAWRAFAGYQFNRYVGAEFGYGDAGEATGQGVIPSSQGGGTGELSLAVSDVFDLSAIFRVPVIGNLSALGRVGVYRARTTLDSRTTADGTAHEAGSNTGFTFGLGAEYLLFNHLGVRAEWQRLDNVGGSSTGEDDIDILSIGLLWRF